MLDLQRKEISQVKLLFVVSFSLSVSTENNTGNGLREMRLISVSQWGICTRVCGSALPSVTAHCTCSHLVPPASHIKGMTSNSTGNRATQREILDYFCYSSVSQLGRNLLNLPKVASYGCWCYHQKLIYCAYRYSLPATHRLLFVCDYTIPAWPS